MGVAVFVKLCLNNIFPRNCNRKKFVDRNKHGTIDLFNYYIQKKIDNYVNISHFGYMHFYVIWTSTVLDLCE